MKKLLNCPNCGAPVTAEKCEYCGTVFLDFAAIQVGAPSYVKFKLDDTYICARLLVTSLDIEHRADIVTHRDAAGVCLGAVNRGSSVEFHLDAVAVCSPGESRVTLITKE